ncbi:MAG TPA: hypothetical protein PKL97_05835, partial [Candidatus Omnitrophota bacterium]|nr:hypothetical protein [Candidatus Omnitrophota bacterium]
MEKYFSKRKQKFVAFVTAFFFLAANTGWSQNPVQISPVTELPAVSFSDPITIPDEIGTIQEEFNSGVGAPFVFFVQDAHAIIDAQNNIQALIDYLGERYDVSLVALEGGKGKLDPTLFRAFPDEKIKQKVFGDYLNRAEMTGAELAAILNSRETACYGIEDWKLYEANYLAYLKAAQKRDAILKELEALKADLDRRRKEIYSPKLNELHEKVRAFKEERSQLIELLKYLKGVSPEAAADGEAYPHLKTLFDSIAQDDSLDKEGLDVAIRDMAEYFRKKYLRGMKKGEVMDFNEKYQGFMTGRMDPATFLRYLLKTSGERGVKFKLTVQLQEFLGYADTLSTIKGTKIFDELERFLDVTEAGMAAKQEERELGGKYKRMDILKDLALLELNREKLREYQKEPEAYLSLVKDRRLFDPAIEFYRFAVGRDGMLRKNLRELMRKENAKAAVVILGGFHTLGFEEGLKESGCSYAVVTPKIRSLRGQEEYDAVMKGKLSYTDYLKTTFYDAFARHAGMKLVAELNEPDFKRILKFWRDELIRKLAAEGRVTEAGEYTKYIDLLVKVYIEKFGAASLASKSKEEILDDVRKALQDANENILSKWWGRFESELGAFMQGFRPLAEKNQVTSESVQTLLRDFGNSKPSNLQAVRAILSYQLSPAELKPFIDAALGKIDFSASEPAEYENVTRAVIVDAAVEALQKQIQPEGVSPEVVAKAEGVVRDILADQDRTVKAMPADVPQSFQASQKFVTGLLSRAEEGVRGETGLAEPQAVKLATLQALRNIQGEQTRESFTQEIPAAKPAPAVKAPENETNLSREAPRVARENQENASAKASAERVIRPEVLSSRHVADTAQSLGANATAKEQVLSRLMDVYVSFLKAGQKVLIDLPENIGNHYHAMGEIAERDGKLVVVTKGNYFDELEGLEYPLETITAITDVKPFIREREGRPFYVLYRVIWDIKDTGKFVGSVSDQGLFSAGLAYVGGDEEELGDFIARNFGFRGDTVDLLERVQDEAFPVTDEDGQAKFATPLMPFSADPSYAIRALKSGREDLAIVEVEVPPDQVVVDMDGGYGWQNKLRARLKENPGLLFANERDGYEAEYTSLAPRIPPQYIGMIYTKDGMVELAKRGEVLGSPESTDAASAETRHSAPTPMVGASVETPWFRHSAPTPMVGASLGDEDDWQAGEMPASDSPEAPRVSVGTFERIAALYDRAARLIRENPRVVRGDFLKLLDEAGEIPRGARTRFEWNLEKFDFDRDRVKRIQKELRLEGVSGQTFLPREIRKSKRLKSFLRETIGFDDVKESLRIEFMPDSIYVLLGAETYRRTHRSPKFSGVAMETQATRLDNSFGFFSTQNEGVWNGISLAGLLSFGKFEGEDPFGADPSTQTHEEFHKWQWTYSAGRETDSWTWPDEGRGIRFGILEEMAALMADQAGFAMDWDSFVRWFSSYAEDLGVEGDEATLRSFFDVLRIVQAFNWGRYLLEIAKRKESDVPVSPDEMIAAIEKSARSTAIRLEALSRSGEDEAVGDLWRGLMRGWARRTVWGALEKRIGGIFSKDPGDEARKKEIEAIRQSLDSEEAAWDIFSQWFGRVMGDFPLELSSGESSLLWENPHFTGAFFHAIMTRLGREVGRRFLRNVEGYMAKAPGLTGVSAVQMRKSLSEYLARTEDESPASAQSMGEDAVRGEVTGAVLESGENAQATASSLGALPVAVQGTAARITGAVEARRARKARDRELRRLILSYGRAESDEARTDIWGEVVGLIAGSDLEMIRGRTNGTVSEVRTAAGLMFRIGYSRMEGREVFEVRIPGAMGRFFDLVPEWGARFDSAIQNRFESLRNCVKYQAVVYQDVLSRNPPKGLSETRDISIKQLADIEDPLERIALRESLFLWFAQLWKECDPAGRAFVEAHREELVSAITDIVRQGVGVLSDFEFRTDYFVRIVSDRDLSDGDKMFFLNPGILGTVSKMRERENIRDIAHLITDSTVEINVRRTVAGSAYLLAVHRSILKKSAASETQRSEMLARFFNAAESFENCPAKDIDESPWVKGVLGVNCDLAQMEAFMSLTPEDVQAMLHPKVLEAVGQMTPNERSRAFEHIVLGKHPEVVRYGVECFGGEDFSVGTLKAYLIYYCNTQVLRDSRAEEFLLSAQLRDLTEAMGDGFSERMFKEGIDIALPSMVPIPYADAVKDLSAIAKNISAVAREISFKELDDLLPEPSELREEIFRAWYNKIIFHGKTDREGGVTSEQNKNLLAVLRYLLETHADEGAVKEFLRPLAVREYHEYRGQFVLLPLWTDRASIERMLGFGQAFTRTILKVLSDNVKNGSLRGNVRESVESFMTGYGTLFAELKGASKVVLVAEHLGRYFLRSEPRPSLIVDPSSLVGLLNQMDESGIGAYLHWLTGTESQEKRRENVLLGDKDFMDRILEKFPQVYAADFIRIFPTRLGKDSYLTSERDSLSEEERAGRFPIEEAKKRIWENLTENEFGGVLEALAAGDLSPGMAFAALMSKPLMKLILEKGWRASVPDVFRMISDESADLMTRWGGIYLLQEIGRAAAFLPGDSLDEVRESFSEGDLRTSIRCLLSPFASPGEAILAVRRDEAATAILDFLLKLDPPAFYRALRDVKGEVTAGEGVRLAVSSVLMQEEVALQVLSSLVESEGEKEDVRKIGTRLFYDSKAMFRLFLEGMLFDDSEE